MTSSPVSAARSQDLPDLPARVPGPRKRRGRRHGLAGLLSAGIAAVIAGSRSFAAIGQRAGDAGPDVPAALGAAGESTFRRAFALASAGVPGRVPGAWPRTGAVRAGGRPATAAGGKTVPGAENKHGKAPHPAAALVHGIGTVLGQGAADETSDQIPAVRELPKAFADLADAVITTGAMHARHDSAQPVTSRHAGCVMTVKANMPALYRQLKRPPRAGIPAVWDVSTGHGRRARRTIKAVPARPGPGSGAQPRPRGCAARSPRTAGRPPGPCT
jgi:hypothetical protein